MMSKRSLLGLAAAVAALCLTAGGVRSQQPAGRGDATEEFHQTYQLAPGGRVRLENINGDVRVRAWDQNEVKVDAVKYAHAPERLREVEIVVAADPQFVRVRTRYDRESLTWHADRRLSRENPASVDYVLTVPRGARIDQIDLVNGALDIENLTGQVSASSVNGKVTARGLTGNVKLSTVNGGLEAAFEQLGPNPVQLTSVNGPVTLTLPSDANAEVRASTVHGAITNDVSLPVKRGKYVGHSLAGRFGAGATSVRLNNVNGPIRLRRAQDGRPASPVVNLLLETARDDGNDEWDEVNREVEREVREAEREAQREVREALREAEQERREALKEATRERLEGQRERERERLEAQREQLQGQRERERERLEAQREAEQERREAVREAAEERRRLQEEARVIARDSARVSREVAREIGRGTRVEGDDRRQIERVANTVAVAGSPRVRISNFDGPVTVIAWDKPEVMYTAVKRAYDAREMQGIKINTSNTPRAGGSGPEIVISANFDKAHCHQIETRGERIISIGCDASVEFEVYVPRSSTLNVNSADGRLRVDGVNGDVEAHTGDGQIDLSGGRGRLRAHTGDGRIRIVDYTGEVSATTGDGRIMLEGDFSQLSARTGDGSISLAIPDGTNAIIETDAETVNSDGMAVAEDGAGGAGRGVRRWKIGSGGRVYTLRTGDGQIILRRR